VSDVINVEKTSQITTHLQVSIGTLPYLTNVVIHFLSANIT